MHAVGIAHKLVGAFAHSWKKKRNLIKVQSEMDLPHHSLVTETHWGTCYKMLDRTLEQERALLPLNQVQNLNYQFYITVTFKQQ